jgi:hypothetical protein
MLFQKKVFLLKSNLLIRNQREILFFGNLIFENCFASYFFLLVWKNNWIRIISYKQYFICSFPMIIFKKKLITRNNNVNFVHRISICINKFITL